MALFQWVQLGKGLSLTFYLFIHSYVTETYSLP